MPFPAWAENAGRDEQRRRLRARLPEFVAQAYRLGLLRAQRETGLGEQSFPAACPWTPDQLLDEGYLPDHG